jgi:hypothetical protein
VGSGILILDANIVWQLEDPLVRQRIRRSLRIADLELRPTAINLLEIIQTTNAARRAQLLEILADLAEDRGVRPLPSEVLRLTGQMIANENVSFEWPPSDFEWMLHEPDRLTNVHIEAAARLLTEEEENFDRRHRAARRHIRQYLKEKGSKDPWGNIVAFLEGQWTRVPQLDAFIDGAWTTLQLPGTPNHDKVIRNEAWRLYLEGFGATVYERAIHAQTLQPAHAADIRQLVYLAGSTRRVLVTDDGGLRRVAASVLERRYEGTRVLPFKELLALAS